MFARGFFYSLNVRLHRRAAFARPVQGVLCGHRVLNHWISATGEPEFVRQSPQTVSSNQPHTTPAASTGCESIQ